MRNVTPSADGAWFAFSLDDERESAGFGVYAVTGREERNAPYCYEIELVSPVRELDLTGWMGRKALLTLCDRGGGRRLVHGSLWRMEHLRTGGRHTHYRCELVPALRFLEFTRDHRIFQHLAVPRIIEEVLRKHHFPVEDFDFYLSGRYEPREYCVQYGESDLHFISRLCEEEGIAFSFEHEARRERICFSDVPGGPPVPGESRLRYHPGSGQRPDTAVISRLDFCRAVGSPKTTLRDWNFLTPSADLTVHEEETDVRRAPVPPALHLETYQYPQLYKDVPQGAHYADVQLKRQRVWNTWIELESDAVCFVPGCSFEVYGHPREEANGQWAVVAAEHAGSQPAVLREDAPEERAHDYRVRVTAIPLHTRFVPEIRHPKQRIPGLQSAIVCGLSGEEVYCDALGRIKVQFHWDRLGARNEDSSCWLRVAGPLAGDGFGVVRLPRLGQEVMVEFLEGDPDRPVVTGRWYNEERLPPWRLPEQKALSGVQSREFGQDRRNQLLFDDTAGSIQAQLSCDHGLSQLNLGRLVRIDHVSGRKDFRGEGFELRTDDWGVLRAGRGLFLSTDARAAAGGHHKSATEAQAALDRAAARHGESAGLARQRQAQDEEDGAQVAEALRIQADELRGPGMRHEEFSTPHILLSSGADAALTAGGTGFWHAERSVAVTAERHGSISAGGSLLVSAMRKVRLFAGSLGMRLMAARGKLSIQAQSGALDLVAARVASIISTSGGIRISSPSSILLSAGGSYLKLGINGIELGTAGAFDVYSGGQSLLPPREKDWCEPDLPQAEGELEQPPHLLKFAIIPAAGHAALPGEKYTVYCRGEEFATGYSDEHGQFSFEPDPGEREYDIELTGGHRYHITLADTPPQGREGQKQRLLREGFRSFVPWEEYTGDDYVFAEWEALHGKAEEDERTEKVSEDAQ